MKYYDVSKVKNAFLTSVNGFATYTNYNLVMNVSKIALKITFLGYNKQTLLQLLQNNYEINESYTKM